MFLINHIRITGALVASVIFGVFPATQVVGQDPPNTEPDPLNFVQSVSAMTGRPIFAVAGQST